MSLIINAQLTLHRNEAELDSWLDNLVSVVETSICYEPQKAWSLAS